MRLIFAGTPEFSVAVLDAVVAAGYEVALVLCQPDRPAGRGQRLLEPPVKQRALALGLPVMQPQRLRDEGVMQALAQTGAEVMLVVAYGLILPAAVLALPPRGCINVHASLLPRWRGAAPIQRAIEAGETGVLWACWITLWGSTCTPLTRNSKCKCGPVERPVLPTSAIFWPRLIKSPFLTKLRERWA